MADSDSDQEYEQIDLERGKGPIVSKKWSPNKKPPLPPPNIKAAERNAYVVRGDGSPILAGIRRAQSMQEGMEGSSPESISSFQNSLTRRKTVMKAPPPPIPPLNSTSDTPPPLPPLNAKPRSISVARPAPQPPPTKPKGMKGAPEIPPKPGTVLVDPWKELAAATTVKRKREEDFTIESEEMNPENFASKHRDEFPLHVRVSKGFYGTSERTSVSEGDTFNIHFIKKTKVVCIEDGGGEKLKVALNSGIEFGVLYNPNNNREEAMTGFTFEKVSDMLSVKTLPKAVRVGVAWRGGSPDNTVEKNELLIIRGWKRKISGKLLKVINPNTKEKKELPENCQGNFSTRPYDTRLFLTDLMEHAPHPLPCSAVIYANSDMCTNSELPNSLTSGNALLKMQALTTETSLIATSAMEEQEVFDEAQTVEIPLDLDIEFQVMRPKEEKDTEDLYMNTRKLLENFKKMKRAQYVTTQDSGKEAQAALYSIIREGQEFAGVDIVKPAAIYKQSSVSPRKSTRQESVSVEPDTNLYEDCDKGDQIDALHTRLDRMQESMMTVEQRLASMSSGTSNEKASREITAARADVKRMEQRCNKAGDDATKALTEITELRNLVQILMSQTEKMGKDLVEVRQLVLGKPGSTNGGLGKNYMALSHTSPLPSLDGEEALCEANKKFLATLDFVQVLSLLECMGLSQHHQAFMEERVNGEILLECDDSVLREELKITSKLQRLRLLKVVQGKHSAEGILSGEDPYTYAQPR